MMFQWLSLTAFPPGPEVALDYGITPHTLTLSSPTFSHVSQGFARLKASLNEEALDYGPAARPAFSRLVEAGTKAGWLALDPEA